MKSNIVSLFFVGFLTLTQGFLLKAQDSDFYTVDSIQEIKIEFGVDNWKFVLDSLRFNGDELLEAKVEINGQVFTGAGVRIRASRAFSPGEQKNSLYIKLDHSQSGQDYQGHAEVLLSQALRDPSMIREVLGYEIARKYMPAPQANYAKVLINSEYYGLFVNLEPIDKAFLEKYFADGSGDLFFSNPPARNQMNDGCNPIAYGGILVENKMDCYGKNFDLIMGEDFSTLDQLAKTLKNNADEIDKVLDVDRALWMLAYNNVLVNLSSYSGNFSPHYFLYRKEDGRFTPIIWDLNLNFGSYKNTGEGSDLKMDELPKLDPYLHADNENKPLIKALLADKFYKKLYLSHMRTLLYNEFVSGDYEIRAKELQEMIRVALINDRNRYYDSGDFDKSLVATIGKISKIPGVVSFMNQRTRFLKKYSDLLILPPTIENLREKTREKYSRERIENYQISVAVSSFTNAVDIFYRFDPSQPFQRAEMLDDGKHFDENAGDNIFGVIIEPGPDGKKIEYYIRAENARMVSYLPERYMYERQETSLFDLNR